MSITRRGLLGALAGLIAPVAVAQAGSNWTAGDERYVAPPDEPTSQELAERTKEYYEEYLLDSPNFQCPFCLCACLSNLIEPLPSLMSEVVHYDGRYNTDCANYGKRWKINIGKYVRNIESGVYID